MSDAARHAGDEGEPLALRASPHRVRVAGRAAGLPDATIARAVEIAVATPGRGEWRRFLSATLAALGAGLLLAGAVAFIAYNWTRIGRFGKFALVELAIVAAAWLGWKRLPRLSGQIGLFSASVLAGVLLALFGQTYQTGADPYGLFLTWALLILPWAFAARFGANWLLVLLLLDVALGLWFAQVLAVRRTSDALYYPVLVAAMHVVAVVAWEWQLRRVPPVMDESWAVRVMALIGFVALFVPAAALVVIDTEAGLAGLAGGAGLAAAVLAALRHYSRVRRERFMQTLAATAAMALVTVALGRVLFDWLDLGLLGHFAIALFVVWQMSWGLKLYRRTRAP